MPASLLVELTDRRLVYRPWKVGSALVFVIAGIVLLIGTFIWAQMNDRTLQSVIVFLLFGAVLTGYGLIYTLKNAEVLIFDVATGRITKKAPFCRKKISAVLMRSTPFRASARCGHFIMP
jgi:hypothetical protein